jgi:lipopolysaccharide transport system permease protein
MKALWHFAHSTLRHRDLLRALVLRELASKYRGSFIGTAWIVLSPLLMLLVYFFVFHQIFGVRWTSNGTMHDFLPMLYCGLLLHGFLAESLSRCTPVVFKNAPYVKKVIFPLEILPVSLVATAFIQLVIGLLLLVAILVALGRSIPPTIVFLPLIIAPLFIITIGLSWIVAAMGVFFRDLEHVIGYVMSILLFLSPIFYPASSAPALAQEFLAVNPLSYPIEELRNIAVLGHTPDWSALLFYMIAAIVIVIVGASVFNSTKNFFADVV